MSAAADEPTKKKKKKKKDKTARPPKPPRPKFVAAKYEGEHDDDCFMCFKGGGECCRAAPSLLPPPTPSLTAESRSAADLLCCDL